MPTSGPWKGAAGRIENWERGLRDRCRRALEQAAVFLVGKTKEGIIDQAPGGVRFKPLHPFTVSQRRASSSDKKVRDTKGRFFKKGADGGHKRLINNGDLLGAITYGIDSTGFIARVGVIRNAKNAEGDDLVDIARIQSEGRVIPITEKMRMYLHAQGLHLKASTTHIIIPPSPFIEPVFEQYRAEIIDRLRRAVTGG